MQAVTRRGGREKERSLWDDFDLEDATAGEELGKTLQAWKRKIGILEYWNKCWDTGISVGILEYWNVGIME